MLHNSQHNLETLKLINCSNIELVFALETPSHDQPYISTYINIYVILKEQVGP